MKGRVEVRRKLPNGLGARKTDLHTSRMIGWIGKRDKNHDR